MIKLVVVALALTAAVPACTSSPDQAADAGPDAPPPTAAIPDLRFRWVGAFPAYSEGSTQVYSSTSNASDNTAPGGRSPLQLGGSDDSWLSTRFAPVAPVAPLDSTIEVVATADAETRLQALVPGQLVTSLDYGAQSVAISVAQLPTPPLFDGGFVLSAAEGPDQLDAYVRKLAHDYHAVVTAFGPDGNVAVPTELRVFGGVLNTDHTVYETQVVTATTATLPAAAAALAAGGYIITAMGRTSTASHTDVGLVGTRVPGMSARREVVAVGVADAAEYLAEGYAIVGSYVDPASGGGSMLLER
jgi:hypothetical protein